MSSKEEMSARDDSTSRKSSVVFHRSYKPPIPSSSSQPFFFRQYTEFITPTKQGNVAVQALSLSVSTGKKWQKDVSQALFSSFSSGKSEAKIYKPGAITSGPSDKPFNIRSRFRQTPPSKKTKVELFHGDTKNTESNPKGSGRHQNKKSKKVDKLHWKYILIISLIPLLLVLGAIKFMWPVDVSYEELPNSTHYGWNLNLKHLHETLNKRVFGQEAAITSLLNILDNFLNKNMGKEQDMPVILMSGSSGVGKSLISSILVSTFPPPGRTELVLSPTSSPQLILQKFSQTYLNLVVVDSLNPDSISDTIEWTRNLLTEAIWQNRQVLVILVHNLQVWNGDTVDDTPLNLQAKGKDLHKNLISAGFDSYHIHLEPLTTEHVNNCIRAALEKLGLHNDVEKYVQRIRENINYRYEGCKSVWRHAAASVDFV